LIFPNFNFPINNKRKIKFSKISCQHLHIYRKWPSKADGAKHGQAFNLFAHVRVQLKDNKSEEDGQAELASLLGDLQKMLRAKGANFYMQFYSIIKFL
jgi:hypothetical protein